MPKPDESPQRTLNGGGALNEAIPSGIAIVEANQAAGLMLSKSR
jgi:hypothetical protein